MPELAPGIQNRRDRVMGWIIFLSFLVLFYNISVMPRTPLEDREPLVAFHLSMGLVVAVLAIMRLFFWVKGPQPAPPQGLPAASFAFNRALLMAMFIVYGLEGIGGFLYAWGIGHHISLFGIPLPPVFGKSEALRMSQGYFHSALGFYYLMLFCIWLAFGCYQNIRYKVGLRRLFPGSQV
jgi:cytochrome b561